MHIVKTLSPKVTAVGHSTMHRPAGRLLDGQSEARSAWARCLAGQEQMSNCSSRCPTGEAERFLFVLPCENLVMNAQAPT